MKERKHINTNKVIEALDLPPDLFLGLPNISMCGNNELCISNHRGILSYGQEEMHLLMKDGEIQIAGSDLSILSFSKDEIIIKGIIRQISFL